MEQNKSKPNPNRVVMDKNLRAEYYEKKHDVDMHAQEDYLNRIKDQLEDIGKTFKGEENTEDIVAMKENLQNQIHNIETALNTAKANLNEVKGRIKAFIEKAKPAPVTWIKPGGEMDKYLMETWSIDNGDVIVITSTIDAKE